MAVMIPESCPAKASAGEKKLFDVLRANLDDSFCVWYEPVVQHRYPDFVIVSPTFGVLILEVKGWYHKHIQEATNNGFVIKRDEGTQTEPSPLRQADSYFYALKEKCQGYPILLRIEGEHAGRLAFPVGVGAVMSNITKDQAEKPAGENGAKLTDLLPADRVAFRDELLNWENMEEREFLKRLKAMFTVNFDFMSLTEDQMSTLKGILHPEVKVAERPATEGSVPGEQSETLADGNVIVTLDARQERLAKSIGGGHRVFFGVAGSGKTLLLLARARMLADADAGHRVLVLCFNKVLAAHLRSVLHEDETNPQYRRIKVLNFHSWAKEYLGPRFFFSLPDGEEREFILGERILSAMERSRFEKYDSVLIDEAHTFEKNWFRCCVNALNDPENGNLMIVCDGSQSLYQRKKFRWSEVGVNARGRTASKLFHLDVNYRNTQEILDGAWAVLKPVADAAKSDGDELGEATFPIVEPKSCCHGAGPQLIHDPDQVPSVMKILARLENAGVAEREIAILYRRRDRLFVPTFDKLLEALEEAGRPYYWVTENEAAKAGYSANRDGVRICTVLSALGLEFRAVIILALDQYSRDAYWDDLEERARSRRELYVGMTRAKELLFVLYQDEQPLADELKASLRFESEPDG